MMAAPSPPVVAYRAAQSIAILSVGDDSQWNDCGCFSTLKISLSTLQQNQISSQFRIRSSEVSEEREKEREKERD